MRQGTRWVVSLLKEMKRESLLLTGFMDVNPQTTPHPYHPAWASPKWSSGGRLQACWAVLNCGRDPGTASAGSAEACEEVLSLGVSSFKYGVLQLWCCLFLEVLLGGILFTSDWISCVPWSHGHLSAVAAIGSKHVSEREVKKTPDVSKTTGGVFSQPACTRWPSLEYGPGLG